MPTKVSDSRTDSGRFATYNGQDIKLAGTTGKTTILFLCTGNACRSQMAEGWARHLRGQVMEVYSAGLEKHGPLEPQQD